VIEIQAMELVNLWIEKPIQIDKLDDLIEKVESSNPYLEVAECSISLNIIDLYDVVFSKLTDSEKLILELITLRNKGDYEKMFFNIEQGLELVRDKENRDLVLEGRLRMELGLLKIQSGSEENPESDFEWALRRLSSVCEFSRLHGLAIINKAAYHEKIDEKLMALHLYGEIPLNGNFPLEVVAFSRVGAARILTQIGHISDACRHLYNAHKIFTKSNNTELAWHSGFQFLSIASKYVDINADLIDFQILNAKPRELGDEIPEPKIHPKDLMIIANNLKKNETIYKEVDESIKSFVDSIIKNTSGLF
tara:strand:+ start:2556 stop:3476 length:921 start_codon:yes stop_codon:yes gene_type:complete